MNHVLLNASHTETFTCRLLLSLNTLIERRTKESGRKEEDMEGEKGNKLREGERERESGRGRSRRPCDGR